MTIVSVTPQAAAGVGVTRAGPRGKGWNFADGAPSDAVGANGDMYLDLETFTAYGPKIDGSWAGTAEVDLTAQADLAIAAQAAAEEAAATAESEAAQAALDRIQTGLDRTAAASSASGAAGSATAAATSASTATSGAATATTKAAEASDSADNAAASASGASGSATASATSAAEASGHADDAGTAKTAAEAAATSAEADAVQTAADRVQTGADVVASGASATSAAGSATAADGSADSAAGSATIATTKAGEASTSAANAAASESAAAGSASAAAASESAAAGSASDAATSKTDAEAAATSAGADATQTAADRVQTGIDRAAAEASAAAAATFDPDDFYDKTEADGLLAAKAPLASPALTGTPTAPTAALGTNTTQIATMAALHAAVTAIVDGAPGALDNFNELAAALGDDPNFATTILTALSGKAPTVHTHTVAQLSDASANGRSLISAANYAAMQTLLSLVPGTHVQAYDADTAKLDVDQQWSGAQRGAVAALSISSGTISWALATANNFTVTLTANAVLNLPSDIASFVGQQGRIAIKQDGTGGRTFGVASGIEELGSGTLSDILDGANEITYLAYDVVDAGTLAITLSGVGG